MKTIIILLAMSCLSCVASAQTISYQGQIAKTDGMPLEGTHRISVSLWSSESGGTPVWTDEFVTNVRQGVFNLQLGSNSPLPLEEMDKPLWLSTSIDGETPAVRTELSAVPYALSSNTLSTDYVSSISVNGRKLTGIGSQLNIETKGIDASYDEATSSLMLALSEVANSKGANVQSGSPSTVWWGELGNTSITVPTNFIGTADASPDFEIHLEDVSRGTSTPDIVRIAHFHYNSNSPDITMGYGSGSSTGNLIGSGVKGSTIAGGGKQNAVNEISADYSFIGGGYSNVIGEGGSVISGGTRNEIHSPFSAIGGGDTNYIKASTTGCTISGGSNNSITLNPFDAASCANYGFIGGGSSNTIGFRVDADD